MKTHTYSKLIFISEITFLSNIFLVFFLPLFFKVVSRIAVRWHGRHCFARAVKFRTLNLTSVILFAKSLKTMGFGKKVLIYMQENVVLLSGAAIIVATHWGWSKLQENPALVPENEKKDLPVIIVNILINITSTCVKHIVHEQFINL